MELDGISNQYIDQLMQEISYTFRGTFSADNIPEFEGENFSLIINLSNVGEKGSHFIAVSISENQILYFDSFGSLQTNSNIEKYLKRYKKRILYTKYQIQHLISSHCGFFCISFILCMESKISIQNFFKMFYKKKLYLNDFICVDIITYFITHMYLRESNNRKMLTFLRE